MPTYRCPSFNSNCCRGNRCLTHARRLSQLRLLVASQQARMAWAPARKLQAEGVAAGGGKGVVEGSRCRWQLVESRHLPNSLPPLLQRTACLSSESAGTPKCPTRLWTRAAGCRRAARQLSASREGGRDARVRLNRRAAPLHGSVSRALQKGHTWPGSGLGNTFDMRHWQRRRRPPGTGAVESQADWSHPLGTEFCPPSALGVGDEAVGQQALQQAALACREERVWGVARDGETR